MLNITTKGSGKDMRYIVGESEFKTANEAFDHLKAEQERLAADEAKKLAQKLTAVVNDRGQAVFKFTDRKLGFYPVMSVYGDQLDTLIAGIDTIREYRESLRSQIKPTWDSKPKATK